MKFSIIIPVFNRESHLRACVESILTQTHQDFELLLVDDGSSDRSPEMCRAFATEDGRVRVFLRDHQGVSAARNHGLAMATGEYVTFIDSDDTVSESMLQDAHETLFRTPCDLVVFSVRHLFCHDGGATEHVFQLNNVIYPQAGDFLDALIRKKTRLLYSAGNKFYRRSILIKQALSFATDIDFGEDRLFNFNYLRHCGSIATRALVAYDYHIRPDKTLSSCYRENMMDTALFLHREKTRLLDEFNLQPDCLHSFLITDLQMEIRAAIRHLEQHWSHLDFSARCRATRRLAQARYPDYIRELRLSSWTNRIVLTALRGRCGWLLYTLFQAAHYRA